MNEDPRTAAIVLASLVIGYMVGAFVQAYSHEQPVVTSTDISSNLELIAGECFVHNGQLEPWEPWYEGQVLQVGYKKYLVQSSDARLKYQYDGHYQGIEIPKSNFERTFHKVDCPKLWRK